MILLRKPGFLRKELQVNRRGIYLWPGFMVFLGVSFFAAPLMRGKSLDAFTSMTGAAFFIMGVVLLFVNRAAFASKRE